MVFSEKESLVNALQRARDSVVWKVAGLGSYDQRRPLVPTGTNLLGLVKHLAGCEFGYFGEVFGRPLADPPAWMADDAEPNADMFATAAETSAEIIGWYQRAWAHADATIAELSLDAVGRVPWWREGYREVTLHHVLVHMIAETARHAGHADILRELIDGSTGLRADNSNLPQADAVWWASHVERLERIAREANG